MGNDLFGLDRKNIKNIKIILYKSDRNTLDSYQHNVLGQTLFSLYRKLSTFIHFMSFELSFPPQQLNLINQSCPSICPIYFNPMA